RSDGPVGRTDGPVSWPAGSVVRGAFGFVHGALALVPHRGAAGGDGITIEAEKRRADSGAALQHADYFDDKKWRRALSDRHSGLERAQTSRRSVAQIGGAPACDY